MNFKTYIVDIHKLDIEYPVLNPSTECMDICHRVGKNSENEIHTCLNISLTRTKTVRVKMKYIYQGEEPTSRSRVNNNKCLTVCITRK